MSNEEKPVDEIVEDGRKAAEKVVDKAAAPLREAATRLSDFGQVQGSSGIILIVAALLALAVANSPLHEFYTGALNHKFAVQFGPVSIDKALLLWINDGLMAIFFFRVGLEIKREFIEGRLRYPSQIALPFFAALGGMVVPATIYSAISINQPDLLQGWAVPMATDIAFALGILALCGDRVPIALKVFLLSVAIFDDVGAVLVIALFYGEHLEPLALGAAFGVVVVLFALNLAGVRRLAVYLLLGLALWVAVLKSGVHATLAGVIAGLFIPIEEKSDRPPLKVLEDRIDPWVAYAIMPLFAFANAGLSFAEIELQDWTEPLTLGIMLGLLLGKPIGVVAGAGSLVLFGRLELPEDVSWSALLGVGILSGIGFTMSLFIGTLAFDQTDHSVQVRLAVFSSSAAAALLGYAILRTSLRQEPVA